MVSDVIANMQNICKKRGLHCSVDRVHDAEAVQCSKSIVQGLVAAVEASEQVHLLHVTTYFMILLTWRISSM